MMTKTNQSALALTAAIFTATLLASTSIPAYASHNAGHGPIAPPHGGQKGGGTLISCHPGGCTETQVKTETIYHNVPPPPTHTVTGFGTTPPTVWHGEAPPPTQTVTGFGTSSIQGQVNGALGIGNGNPTPGTSAIQGEINGALGIGNQASGVPPKQVSGTSIQGVINGALGTGNPGSTQASGLPPKQIVGIASGSNCALFGCVSAPPAPTPPTGGGNPPKHGGGDHDHDHNYPGIVIEGAPGEVVGPAPVAAVPVAAAPVVAARATVAAPQVVQAPCNCLTKQTLADGSVLFQDICTKEAAIAAPQAASVR